MSRSVSVRPYRRSKGEGWSVHSRWRSTPLLVTVLLAALVVPVTADAAQTTLSVDQQSSNCSATAAGTAEQPFCTIGSAAAAAGPGTTVVVAAGTYSEQVTPRSGGATGDPVIFTAARGARVVVTGAAHGFSLSGASNVAIIGFTVIATTGDGIVVRSSRDIRLTGNRVQSGAIGIRLTNASGSRIQNNTVDHNPAGGIRLSASTSNEIKGNAVSFNAVRHGNAGIALYNLSHRNTIRDNVSHDNGDSGIEVHNSVETTILRNVSHHNGDHGIGVETGATQTRIVSNTLARNTTSAIEIDGASSGATLVDNILDTENGTDVTPPAIRVSTDARPGTVMDYNVLNGRPGRKLFDWQGGRYDSVASFAAATGQETHGLQADPRFVAPDEGDLALAPGSPAIDSGFIGDFTSDVRVSFANQPAVDDPATPNTGAGTTQVDYGDRGAYELRNSGFEADTAGWNSSRSNPEVTLSRVADGHATAGAAALTNTGSTPATCTLNDAPTWVRQEMGGTYTATLWVRADTPGATLKLRLREWANESPSDGFPRFLAGEAKTAVTLTTEWQAVKVSYTARWPVPFSDDGTDTSALDLNAYVLRAAPGVCFYADDASIARG